MPLAIADATTSGAIDRFMKRVAFELQRGVRINAVNPTVIEEAWGMYGEMMPHYQPVPWGVGRQGIRAIGRQLHYRTGDFRGRLIGRPLPVSRSPSSARAPHTPARYQSG